MRSTATLVRGPHAAIVLGAIALAALLAAAPAPAAAHSGNDVVSFGHNVTVPENQEVTGDVVVFGGNAKVYGKVDGDAVVMGGDLFIAPTGEVDGDTIAFGGELDNQSKVPGGHHRQKIQPIQPSAPIFPLVTPEPIQPSDVESSGGPNTGWLGFLFVTGILSLLAFAVAPGAVRNVRDGFMRRPILGSAIGFCWPFILIAVVVALCITVIGIVLIPAAVVAAFVAYLVGRAAVGLLLGRRLFEAANVVEPAPLVSAALGLLIITVLEGALPLWMGIVLEAIVGCVAIGAAMLPFIPLRLATAGGPPSYVPPPQPVFTPPSPPPPSGPPAVPQ